MKKIKAINDMNKFWKCDKKIWKCNQTILNDESDIDTNIYYNDPTRCHMECHPFIQTDLESKGGSGTTMKTKVFQNQNLSGNISSYIENKEIPLLSSSFQGYLNISPIIKQKTILRLLDFEFIDENKIFIITVKEFNYIVDRVTERIKTIKIIFDTLTKQNVRNKINHDLILPYFELLTHDLWLLISMINASRYSGYNLENIMYLLYLIDQVQPISLLEYDPFVILNYYLKIIYNIQTIVIPSSLLPNLSKIENAIKEKIVDYIETKFKIPTTIGSDNDDKELKLKKLFKMILPILFSSKFLNDVNIDDIDQPLEFLNFLDNLLYLDHPSEKSENYYIPDNLVIYYINKILSNSTTMPMPIFNIRWWNYFVVTLRDTFDYQDEDILVFIENIFNHFKLLEYKSNNDNKDNNDGKMLLFLIPNPRLMENEYEQGFWFKFILFFIETIGSYYFTKFAENTSEFLNYILPNGFIPGDNDKFDPRIYKKYLILKLSLNFDFLGQPNDNDNFEYIFVDKAQEDGNFIDHLRDDMLMIQNGIISHLDPENEKDKSELKDATNLYTLIQGTINKINRENINMNILLNDNEPNSPNY